MLKIIGTSDALDILTHFGRLTNVKYYNATQSSKQGERS